MWHTKASPALKYGILRRHRLFCLAQLGKELVHQLLIFLFFTCIFCVRLGLILWIHKTTNTRWHFRLLITKHTFHYCCSIIWFGLTLCNFDRKTFIIEFHPLKFRLESPVFLLKSAKLQLTITNLNNTNEKQNKTFQLLLIKILSSCKTFFLFAESVNSFKQASYCWISWSELFVCKFLCWHLSRL